MTDMILPAKRHCGQTSNFVVGQLGGNWDTSSPDASVRSIGEQPELNKRQFGGRPLEVSGT